MSQMTFPIATVEDVAASKKSAIASGPFGSAIGRKFFVPEGVPVIRGNNLTLGRERFVDDGFVFITEEKAQKHRACIVYPDDIIFTAAGSLGQVGIIPRHGKHPKYFISNKQLKLTPDKDHFDPLFLYYWFSSSIIRNHFIGSNRGAAVPLITLGVLRTTPVPAPPLATQRRIASILSAYDDLIENNTRRIAILEEMARRLYEDWFVRFRFPGHEEAEYVEAELGRTPAGWPVKTVDQTFRVVGGGTPSKKVNEYWEGGSIDWYAPTDLTKAGTVFMDGSAAKITPLGLQKSSAQLFPPYSVMLTSRATIGAIAINTREACTNQGFITCIPNERFPIYILLHWLKQNVEQFINLASGATFKEISKGTFRTIKLVVPPTEVAQHYESLVEPMMKQQLILQRKNANLRAQRDLLLPKLVSGEIDVAKAEVTLEAVA